MVYSNIDLLPHIVKASLSRKEDRQMWLDAFNKSYTKHNSFEKATEDAFDSLSESPYLRRFEGWVSTDHLDVQNDVMNQAGLFKAYKNHIMRGGIDVDYHTNRICGSVYAAELKKYDDHHQGIYAKGVVYHGEPIFDKIWDEIQKGEKNSFSIGGFAVKWRTVCNQNGCHREILEPSIQETSHCKNPADPHANMVAYNSFAKSLDEKHLDKDKQILTQIKALVEQMLADDEAEKVSPSPNSNMLENEKGNGVKTNGQISTLSNMLENEQGDTSHGDSTAPPEPFKTAEIKACGCGKPTQIKKIGTKQGVCRGHQSKGHALSSQCQGFGFKDSPTQGKESGVIIDDEFDEKAHRFQPQIFTDERKKLQELNTPVNISEVNNKLASKYIGAFENAMATNKDPRVALAYNKAIKILSEPSGMPVTKRLLAIESMGCPRCKSIIDGIRSEGFSMSGLM